MIISPSKTYCYFHLSLKVKNLILNLPLRCYVKFITFLWISFFNNNKCVVYNLTATDSFNILRRVGQLENRYSINFHIATMYYFTAYKIRSTSRNKFVTDRAYKKVDFLSVL